MLFNKKIPPLCAYCARGCKMDDAMIACPKQGIVRPEQNCRAFRYDPLKREPPKAARLNTKNFRDEDFKID